MNDMFSSIQERKKAIFNSMSKKRREQILRKTTYDQWDPFEEPKDPIDIRTDKTKRLPSILVQEFLRSRKVKNKEISKGYSRGMLEMVIGLINGDDRFVAMYEFSIWYKKLLELEGVEL